MAAIVCFGEVLLRLAAHSPSLLLQDNDLEATFCGAEANVAVDLCGFGHDARMISVLPDNRLGEAAHRELRKFGVDTGGLLRSSGRMGLFFLTPGAMARPAEILYDRAGSAFATLNPADFDWPKIFRDANWLFVGGITAALGSGPLQALQDAMRCARAAGVKIAFDCNFRPSLWQGREAEAARILLALSVQADLVFAGRRAIGMMLEESFLNSDPNAGFHDAATALFGHAPHIQWIAATRRDILNSDSQVLTGLLANREALAVTEPLHLNSIVDRIGTGDAFAAGVVHGLATGQSLDETIQFAIAAAQWSHSVRGDFLRASLTDIAALRAGGDVRR